MKQNPNSGEKSLRGPLTPLEHRFVSAENQKAPFNAKKQQPDKSYKLSPFGFSNLAMQQFENGFERDSNASTPGSQSRSPGLEIRINR